MDIKKLAGKVEGLKVSEKKPSLPSKVNLLGGLIQIKKVGAGESEEEPASVIDLSEIPEVEEEEELEELDEVLTVESILNRTVKIPPEYIDSEGYLIPVRKIDSKTYVPCEFNEEGEPIDPFLTPEGNYVFYDTLAEYTQLNMKRVKSGADKLLSLVDDVSLDTRQGLSSAYRELKVGLTDKIRG